MFGIVDCNNFYASCERVFNPKLIGKPVIVLSNNDGCVIARSDEAKALGIRMGQPFFKIKQLCTQQQVYVYSSNFALYGDMSSRVMRILESSWPHIEIYSIDEVFLHLNSLNKMQIEKLAPNIHRKILQYTGLPVSIGVGPTKTLAKLANYVAKRKLKVPYVDISSQQYWLKRIGIEEVWGVGRQLTKKLHGMGIVTVDDLANTDHHVMRRCFNVMLAKTILELQGYPCLSIEEVSPKQGIMTSRSFKTPLTDQATLAQALSAFCNQATKKCRQQNSVAGRLTVFIRTSPFRPRSAQHAASTHVHFTHPTNDVRMITQLAKQALNNIYKPGYHYKRAGVYLDELQPADIMQTNFLSPLPDELREQSKQVMKTFDRINAKYGSGSIVTAAEGIHKPSVPKQTYKSPCYTTRWSDLLHVV